MLNLLARISLVEALKQPSTPLLVSLGVIAFLAFATKVPINYNLRNLTVRWRTTVMTALAFTVVVGLLTVMMAFVNGMYRLTEGSGQPGNVIILSEGSTDETFSNLGFSDIGDIENQPGVLRENDRPICSRETYIVVNQPVEKPRPGGTRRRFIQVRGLDDPVMGGRVHAFDLEEGSQWFSQAGVQQLPDRLDPKTGEPEEAIQCVIGPGIARELGRDRWPEELKTARNPQRLDVGDVFSVGGRNWLIVGVAKAAGSTFDSEIWAKRDVVGPMFGKKTYSSLCLRTANGAAAKKVKDYFNNDYKKAAVAAQVETEYFARLAETNKQFLFAIIIVSVIMAVGGVFGVMNTMFAAISQRIKDIGVLRIMGFQRRDILASFLLESLAIAIIGGGLGCLVGRLAHGMRATSVLSTNQPGGSKFVTLEMVVNGETLALGLLLAIGMGFIGGLIPALSAMRIRPLESLR